jgi:AcrR family transcriptional regulator
MPRKPIDRRAARTRAKLHEALLALMAKRDYEAISVRDICVRAAIGRSTFYAHYRGKDDLMRGGFKALRDQLAERPAAEAGQNGISAGGFAFSLDMFEHARDHARLHGTNRGDRAIAIARESVRAMLAELVRRELAAAAARPQEAMPRELVVHYVVGAFMGVCRWWLESGDKLSARQVDALFRRLTTEGIA